MYIKELSNEEFKNFTNNYNLKSIYQTIEYGFVMNSQKFDSLFLGLIDNSNNIIAATLILVETKLKFKYAYAPRGFLLDYNNSKLLEEFTTEIKKYLNKKNIIAIKINPIIIKNSHDYKENQAVINKNFTSIFDNLIKLGYYHLGFNNSFEGLKPRFEAVIDLDLPYYLLFKNIKKEFKTKIRSAENSGIMVHKGTNDNLNLLYLQTKNKYPRDLNYFSDCFNFFKKDDNIEFYYTKLDTHKHLNIISKKFSIQENLCNDLNDKLIRSDNKNILSQKMESDLLLNKYKNKLIKATKYLKDFPEGIVTSSVLIIKNNEEIYMFMDGYDAKYKQFNSKHLLIWKLMEKYSNDGYKKFNLGGISNPSIEDKKYAGLNEFKLGFNSKSIEYIGDFELVTNSTLYFMFKNTFSIRNILKK